MTFSSVEVIGIAGSGISGIQKRYSDEFARMMVCDSFIR
jgi:hypothetical protein